MPLPDEILEQIPEEYRGHDSLNDFNDIAALAKSYVETKAMVGNSIRVPGPDAGEEAYQEYLDKIISHDPKLMMKPDFGEAEQSREFFRTIGLPEEAIKYENPEGMELDEAVEAEMRGLLYDAQIPQAAYAKIMAAFSDRQKQTVDMNTELQTSDMSELKGKWGMAYDDRTAAARKMNDEFYPGRKFDNLNRGELEALYTISTSMTGKGAQAAGDAAGIPTKLSPDEAVAQADEIMKRLHDPKSELTHDEKMKLQYKRIDLLQKYGPYQKSAAA